MLLTTLLLTTSIYAGQVPEPSAKEVKTVLDYYYQGERPILAEVYLCAKVEEKDKETKHNCVERFGSTAAKGDVVYVYIVAMVPRKQKGELMVQAIHDGVVRSTKDITLTGRWFRSRAWRAFALRKPGKWDFKVLGGSGKILRQMTVNVPADS